MKTIKQSVLFLIIITFIALEAKSQQHQFFHIKNIDGYWWVIDPDGKPFHMRGITHYGNGKYMPWNVEEKYQSVDKWRESIRDRHVEWGFTYLPPSIGPNIVGPTEITRQPEWGAEEFASLEYPFAPFLEVPKQYMAGEGLPDVFSGKFLMDVEKRVQEFVVPLVDNKNLIGYHFTHNPPWNINVPHAIDWIEANTQPNSEGLKRWIELMKRVYGTVENWQKTYGVPIQEWSDIHNLKNPLRDYINPVKGRKDRESFLRQICKKWYQVYHDSIREYDKNHLLLGDRNTLHFHYPPANWAYHIMDDYIDVLSVNIMGTANMQYEVLQETLRYWDGPILLADTGAGIYEKEPGVSHFQAKDITEFEKVYSDLIKMNMEHPQIIGFGWGGYYEKPVPEDESRRGNSGVVKVENGEPIEERIRIMKKWNGIMDDYIQEISQ